MNVPVYCSHNPALSLWQSAVHSVISKSAGSQNSGNQGVGISATSPRMLATAEVLKHFDATGNFNLALPPGPAGAAAPGSVSLAASAAPSAAPATATLPVVECAKLAAQVALYAVTDPAKAATLRQELTDGTCDPLWVECLAQYDAWRAAGTSQPYIDYKNLSDFVLDNCLPDNATIAIIGDWGTGMNDALVLLDQIGANFHPDVLLHLGDIYYSGLPQECAAHFTQLIDQVWPAGGTNPQPLVFTLDGNHDRYAGANGGYYNLIANLNQAAGKPQPNSYFALRNNFWQFVAMDTGFNDSDPFAEGGLVTSLVAQEIPWHLDKINNNGAGVDASANPRGVRGTVLLSHHQLFSFTGVGKNASGCQMAVNPNLVQAFSPVFNFIDLWLWGHEHALCIFEPYANGPGQPLPKGRCIGASAVPIYLSQTPKPPSNLALPPGASGPPQVIPGTALGDNGTVFNYSYAIMRLAGASLSIDYYQVDSTNAAPGNPPPLGPPLYSESIAKPLAAG
jgi:hypothetical protein